MIDVDKIPPEALAKIQAKAAAKADAIDNTELVTQFRASGGQLLHIRPVQIRGRGWSRGLTTAFVVKGNRVTLATALVHTVDHFAKKSGTKTAIEHFLNGHVITLPIPKDKHPVRVIRSAMKYFTGGPFTLI